jgi:hypothetical protein
MSDHRKREGIVKSGSCHVFLALRREKDNLDGYGGRSIFRQIVRDESVDLAVLEAKCLVMGGAWRIYRTVNRRCFKKAFKLFQHRLIDDVDDYLHRVDSLWMNCLLKSESRAEKFFMVDIDGSYDFLGDDGVKVVDVVKSPNGFHVITEPFKVESKDMGRCFKYSGHDVLKDGYVYVKSVGGDL